MNLASPPLRHTRAYPKLVSVLTQYEFNITQQRGVLICEKTLSPLLYTALHTSCGTLLEAACSLLATNLPYLATHL